jgi:hypothetical protein
MKVVCMKMYRHMLERAVDKREAGSIDREVTDSQTAGCSTKLWALAKILIARAWLACSSVA